MPTNDPGLTRDTCFFLEAVSGDGGVHNGGGVFWLSPDIRLTGATSGPDKADPGQHNTIEVTTHQKAQGTCESVGDESLLVEVWVGNPALVMAPNNPASTAGIALTGSPSPLPGGTSVQSIDWVPPTGLPPSDPQGSGHKCLIARSYPSSLTPSAASFFSPDDPHVAQHNICIVPCGNPGAAARPGPCGFTVATLNPNRREAQIVTLRAIVDLKPDRFVRGVVLPRLKAVPGFRRLATAPPARFWLESKGWRGAVVSDRTRRKGVAKPSYTAKVNLARGAFVTFSFGADLSPAKLGDAYVFHLTQTGADGRPQGGLTIAMVAV
jgi:hypothetical protein